MPLTLKSHLSLVICHLTVVILRVAASLSLLVPSAPHPPSMHDMKTQLIGIASTLPVSGHTLTCNTVSIASVPMRVAISGQGLFA